MNSQTRLFAHRVLAGVLAFGAASVLSAPVGHAQSLQEALVLTYTTNPQLESARAALRATDESVPLALSGYRPSVNGTLSYQPSYSKTVTRNLTIPGESVSPKTVGVTLRQPLYDATVTPAVRRAEKAVMAQRAQLMATEQAVLLAAGTAYMDTVRDQAFLDLRINNEQVLRRQLEAVQDRFRVGEVTRTDVSQSESRLAGALADRVVGEATLQQTRATYERVIGNVPRKLQAPKPTFKLPATLEEAADLARTNHPSVLSATFQEAAQRDAVDQQFGRMLPRADIAASAQRQFDLGTQTSFGNVIRGDSASVTASITIPLYQSGQPEALVRQAKQQANQARIDIDTARRAQTENAIRAWQGLASARANVRSYQVQIKAAETALEGVRQEMLVGSRTVLDVLNWEQELLTARVSLVRAQHDELVAAFALLSSVGQFTAQQLALPVAYYDYEAYYRMVRDKWTGLGD
jgi:outer membrane protein/adhesin transport system outer membrane protein